jgi:type II secretory pathway component PulF
MAAFTYTAVDKQGHETTGRLTADSRTAAIDQMLAQGLQPTKVGEVGTPRSTKDRPARAGRVSRASVQAFTRELANLLAGGVPLSRALMLLSREASDSAARRLWTAIYEDVTGGSPLADALAKWPRSFPPVYIAMVQAGETGGFLDMVLEQIADFQTREQDLVGRVKAAMVYPAVLGLLAVGVLTFLMTFFIPRFSSIFSDFGGSLPLLTRAIVGVSMAVSHHGLMLIAVVVGAVIVVRRALTTDAGRRFMERAMLVTPGLGQAVSRFALVRFCGMLGTLVGAGVPLIAALRVARAALGNQILADAVSQAIEEVQHGTTLSKSLSSCPQVFPASVIEMVAVAEETGRLDKELVRLAKTYESELDRRLRMLVALAEPALLFMMAGLIGTIVIGMLLPIFTLQDLVR